MIRLCQNFKNLGEADHTVMNHSSSTRIFAPIGALLNVFFCSDFFLLNIVVKFNVFRDANDQDLGAGVGRLGGIYRTDVPSLGLPTLAGRWH